MEDEMETGFYIRDYRVQGLVEFSLNPKPLKP